MNTICALLLLLALPVSAFPAAGLSAASAGDKDSASLPFDPANNLIVISATLNGRGPYRFLLDTGASHHVLKPELAQSLRLKVREGAGLEAGGQGVVKAGLAQVAEVRVGDFTLARQQFLVTPFPASYPFDGFLGAELFRRLVVSIDFRRALVTFTRPEGFRYAGAGVSLPIKLHEGLIPQVQAEVDDSAGWFKFDTGYNGSLALFGGFIEQHDLLAKYAPQESRPGGQTLTGAVGDAPVARVRSFKLGTFTLEGVATAFFLEKGGSNSAFSGAIGTALLQPFNVVIDYQRQRVILERQGRVP